MRDDQIILDEKLRRGSCMVCELIVTSQNSSLFDFDHRERHRKSWNISRLKGLYSSPDRLVKEMAKCDLLCCMCHRRKTIEERDFGPRETTPILQASLFDN